MHLVMKTAYLLSFHCRIILNKGWNKAHTKIVMKRIPVENVTNVVVGRTTTTQTEMTCIYQ